MANLLTATNASPITINSQKRKKPRVHLHCNWSAQNRVPHALCGAKYPKSSIRKFSAHWHRPRNVCKKPNSKYSPLRHHTWSHWHCCAHISWIIRHSVMHPCSVLPIARPFSRSLCRCKSALIDCCAIWKIVGRTISCCWDWARVFTITQTNIFMWVLGWVRDGGRVSGRSYIWDGSEAKWYFIWEISQLKVPAGSLSIAPWPRGPEAMASLASGMIPHCAGWISGSKDHWSKYVIILCVCLGFYQQVYVMYCEHQGKLDRLLKKLKETKTSAFCQALETLEQDPVCCGECRTLSNIDDDISWN